MGLDMYLYARKNEYKSEWRQNLTEGYPAELAAIAKVDSKCVSINTDYEIGYWRKDNAIHNWFVENCGNGVDECQEIYVDQEKLVELKNACMEVLLDPTKADELLPTCSGFFFGDTEYDEWYTRSIQYTLDLVQGVLEMLEKHPEYQIIYQASW